MKKTAGHFIRITGLVIEMLGIWGVYRASVSSDQARIELPGGVRVSLAWIAVGLGFILWLIGTILTYSGRPRRRVVEKNQRELAP